MTTPATAVRAQRARPRSEGDPAVLALLEEARQRLGSQSASLLVANEPATVLEPYASIGLRQTIRAASRVPIGQGFVNYTVRPKANLATGARVDAQATIVFALCSLAGLAYVRSIARRRAQEVVK